MYLTDPPQLAVDTVAVLTSEKSGWLAGRCVDGSWDVEELWARKGEVVERDLLEVRMDGGLSGWRLGGYAGIVEFEAYVVQLAGYRFWQDVDCK